ncbi:hypothetical protein BGX34_008884 [Mortierella sp. NVP85]|nr:hypothetical protein BGX34_008884 [Mortierella sp. NVP85]
MTNVLKSFGGLIWGDTSQKTIAEISGGQFYRYLPRGGPHQVVYIHAKIAIHRISQPFIFQITVYRLADEDDEDEEDSPHGDDMKFTITQEMEFRQGVVAGSTTFSWKRAGAYDDGTIFEFVCADETSNFAVNTFEATIYQCMYQFKYKKSHNSASDQDFLQFKLASSKSTSLSAPIARSLNTRVKKSSSAGKQPVVKKEAEPGLFVPGPRKLPPNTKRIADFQGELKLWDCMSSLYITVARDTLIRLMQEKRQVGHPSHWLVIVKKTGGSLVTQQLGDRMNPIFNPHTFVWNDMDEETDKCYTWQFQFKDPDAWTSFRDLYSRSLYEFINRDTEKEDDGVLETNQEYYDAKDYEEESEVKEESRGARVDSNGDQEMHYFGDPNDNAKNSQLAIGYKDRSFVVRGSTIGVFGHNERDGLDLQTTITNLSNSNRKMVKPSKVLLHEEDTAMVMMDRSNPHMAYKMDLEYGRIVEEWDLSGTSGVLDLVSDSKYAHRTGTKTMVGVSKDSMFRIDSRQQKNKIVQAEFKQYAASNQFVCGTTTADASVAVAGAKGDIKLFNILGKIAKTALPTYSGPIIGLDVTANGRYLLATCKTCVQVIDVRNPENGELGFNFSFPASAKPEPIVLTLKQEHIAAMKTPLSFTPARFNVGINEEEKTIVTSTGRYVITWNFRRVKLGHKEYQIKEYADTVVADNFKYGQDRSIIVALPNEVTSVQTRNMIDVSTVFGVGFGKQTS